MPFTKGNQLGRKFEPGISGNPAGRAGQPDWSKCPPEVLQALGDKCRSILCDAAFIKRLHACIEKKWRQDPLAALRFCLAMLPYADKDTAQGSRLSAADVARIKATLAVARPSAPATDGLSDDAKQPPEKPSELNGAPEQKG